MFRGCTAIMHRYQMPVLAEEDVEDDSGSSSSSEREKENRIPADSSNVVGKHSAVMEEEKTPRKNMRSRFSHRVAYYSEIYNENRPVASEFGGLDNQVSYRDQENRYYDDELTRHESSSFYVYEPDVRPRTPALEHSAGSDDADTYNIETRERSPPPPQFWEVLHLAQAEMQIAASSAFLQILQNDLVPIQNYTTTFLETILNSVDSGDPEVAGAWLDTLLDVIELLPKDIIKRDVLSKAVAKGQLSQSVQSRLSCCRILGKIATKFEPFLIKKEILPVVQSLCQDVDYEVRGCMCHQLDSVARGLGLEATKSAILPELVELTNDEESHVRLAGLETVVNIISLLDHETCTNTIVPLVCKFCDNAMGSDDMTIPVVAKQLGKLCHGLSANLTEDQRQTFLTIYKSLCKMGVSDKKKQKEEDDNLNSSGKIEEFNIGNLFKDEDKHVECRKNAAFNFPAMLLFIGPGKFKDELSQQFSSLCNDAHVLVRKTIASGFHEVAKLLGDNVLSVQPDLVTLLKDDSIEVLKGVVPHIPEVSRLLVKAITNATIDCKNILTDIIPAIINCEAVISSSNNWRLHEELLANLSCLPKIYTSDQIYNKFIPLFCRKLHSTRALPVRHAACRTLLVLIRYNRKSEQRNELINKIIDECCHGKSCHQRNLFIDISKMVIDIYSRTFFKEYFFEPVLELASDQVPNVRLRLCNILPVLKHLLKLPADRALLQQLDSCVRKILINERDKDVNHTITHAVEEMDHMQVQLESLAKRSMNEDDLADKKKEEEEKLLLEQELKEKKEEEAKALKEAKRKDNLNKKDTKIPGIKKPSKIPALATKQERSGSTGSIGKKLSTGSANSGSNISIRSSTSSQTKTLKNVSSKIISPTASAHSTGSPRLGQRLTPGNGSTSRDRLNKKRGSTSSTGSAALSGGGSRRSSTSSTHDTSSRRSSLTGSTLNHGTSLQRKSSTGSTPNISHSVAATTIPKRKGSLPK
ncbi:serine/threonine-protein phosphatase 4 regulatory subunit 4-like [Tubulanus polymorphus]|uniref:serine/threonine-protein phosphatase 4 regulatory subunit 4-like n=1 Tax=Tubulanus polymorphus TaxID=672921 RepID=UPI003DA5EAD6